MTILDEAAHGLGAALLPVVTGLLLEELTFGGLVRLLIAPWPKSTKRGIPGGTSSPQGHSPSERNQPERNGERKCSH